MIFQVIIVGAFNDFAFSIRNLIQCENEMSFIKIPTIEMNLKLFFYKFGVIVGTNFMC